MHGKYIHRGRAKGGSSRDCFAKASNFAGMFSSVLAGNQS